ncbi:MAG: V-type ATP synthase subunit E [Candidatus Thermoplasmatota archaeon]|jgi:V/A-type H+-transporting ATPase subunit E|nr:V-type ATP synthase subunit E [Candidatus Thermoplasmatota archaeon]
MSAEKIIQQIIKDSEKEIKQIQTEAKKQATTIINTAKKEAQLEAEKIISDGKKQIENTKKIMISKAHQETKRDIMNTKEKIIEDCFTKAQQKLLALKEDEYNRIVHRLISEGCKKIGGQCNVIISKDADKKIAENMGLKVIGNIESTGGVILKSNDGKITLDNTFDGILKREKDKIRVKVGKLLFS